MDTKRHIAIPDDLWTQTKVQAAIEGVGARHIVIRALTKELAPNPTYKDSKAIIGEVVDRILLAHDVKPYDPANGGDVTPLSIRRDASFGSSRPAPKPMKKAR